MDLRYIQELLGHEFGDKITPESNTQRKYTQQTNKQNRLKYGEMLMAVNKLLYFWLVVSCGK